MATICFNGKFVQADQPVITADNRGYRYGDGLFETIRVHKAGILMELFHFERLFSGMQVIKMDIPPLFTNESLRDNILKLCEKNDCSPSARVRVSVSRGRGGLYDGDRNIDFVIEAWPLERLPAGLNENGLVIGVFPDARKSIDMFSTIKSANFLPYSMAAIHAKEQKWNDSLVLNTARRIADATTANIFLVREGIIITPPLAEGPVSGVMRRQILHHLPGKVQGLEWKEAPITSNDLLEAEEIFLSNAIHGIRWVKQLENRVYKNIQTLEIYRQLLQTIPL